MKCQGLGHVTSDKQTPSALDYLGHMREAVNLEKRMMKPGSSRPLKDILSGLVATYNRMATAKKHRIDANRKALIYNMLLGFLKVNHLVATKMLIFIPIYPHYQDPHHQGYVPPMSFTRCSISTMISIGMNLQARIRGLKVSRRGCHKDLNLPTSSHCAAWARNAAGGSPS